MVVCDTVLRPERSRAEEALAVTNRGTAKRNKNLEFDSCLDAKGKETLIAVWRAIEAQKEAAGREKAQIIDDYRNAAIGKMQRHLSEGAIVEEELDDLRKGFEIGHGHYPDSRAWVYLGGLASISTSPR